MFSDDDTLLLGLSEQQLFFRPAGIGFVLRMVGWKLPW
jgi:hypothetical protein